MIGFVYFLASALAHQRRETHGSVANTLPYGRRPQNVTDRFMNNKSRMLCTLCTLVHQTHRGMCNGFVLNILVNSVYQSYADHRILARLLFSLCHHSKRAFAFVARQ